MQLTVEKLVPGGKGFARLVDGRVALVQAVAAQDQIEVLESQPRKGYLEVTQWRLLQASADRVQPRCEYTESCGGCDWMMLSSAAQRAAKQALVREALARTGRIHEIPGDVQWVDSPKAFEYRTRIRLQVSSSGRVGFFSAASHDLVEVPSCAVAAPEINDALRQLRDWAKRHPQVLAGVAHVEIRSAPDQPLCVCLTGSATKAHPAFGELRDRFNVSWAEDAPDPSRWQRYPLQGDVYLEAPPATFTQVNWEVNQLLIEQVVSGALQRGVRSFLDLYSGSGNFTLPLLSRGLEGSAVESSVQSIEALRRSAAQQRLKLRTAHSGSVEDFVLRAAREGQHYDLVLLDPPRAGIKANMDALTQLATRHVAICSCDPVTLARDLRALLDRDFALEQLTAFDMFPQTHHVEVLAWLVRST
jgi:23S rRNA (uracil1939-C5)-methyltransferase